MPNKNNFLKFVLLAGDVFLMYATLFLALAVRYGDFDFLPGPQTRAFLFHFSFIFILWALSLYILNFYEISSLGRVFDFLRSLLIFSCAAAAVGISYFYLRPDALIAPKTILLLHVLFFAVLFYCWRYVFSRTLKLSHFKEKVIIIGFRPGLEELADKRLFSQAGYELMAFFSPDSASLKKLLPFASLAKKGVVSDILQLKEIIKEGGVSSVVFPRFFDRGEKIVQQIFNHLPLNLNYIAFADFYENLAKKVPVDAVNEAWFLENISRPGKKLENLLKKVFDVLFSAIGLAITAILLIFIAPAIKIDSSGPIFYSQKRVGRGGKVFKLYKLRTMMKNAEDNGPQWASSEDPRTTRLGRVLRKLHIDEFPQFFHILKGDISFVGPRPERPEFVAQLEKEIPYYEIRHVIKPGFTGWAQINYTYTSSVEEAKEKFKYDLYYIKNRNLFMDLGIILKTIRIIFR